MGMTKQTKNRFILIKGNEELTQAPTVVGLAEFMGINHSHISRQLKKTNNSTFKFRKITYLIIDKLDEI
jgi:hypothetical protein